MSNVKLATLKENLPACVYLMNITVVDAYKLNYEQTCQKIFQNYDELLVVLTPFRDLPIPEYANHPNLKRSSFDEVRRFIFHQSGIRTMSPDGVRYYDVYRLWWLSPRAWLEMTGVDKILWINFGTFDLDEIKDIWGYEYRDLPETELRKIISVDLRYPILVDQDLRVVDGCHRLIKAKWLGYEEISVRKIYPVMMARALISDWENHKEFRSRFTC